MSAARDLYGPTRRLWPRDALPDGTITFTSNVCPTPALTSPSMALILEVHREEIHAMESETSSETFERIRLIRWLVSTTMFNAGRTD